MINVQGMVVGDDESVSLPFVRYVRSPTRQGALLFEDELVACDDSITPDFAWRNPSGKFQKPRTVGMLTTEFQHSKPSALFIRICRIFDIQNFKSVEILLARDSTWSAIRYVSL